MGDRPKLHITEKESIILRDICFARMRVMKAGDVTGVNSLPIHSKLSEFEARQSLPVFDFFRSVYSENEEAVKRLAAAQHRMGHHAGGVYYDGMIADFKGIMEQMLEKNSYSIDDVISLQNRMKDYIKEQKVAPPRTLYIADCHFYHRRLNMEMDRRGFKSVEAMNDHMIQQWNSTVNAKDTVYILGDFSLAGGFQTSGLLQCLNGKKHLITGNHDRYLKDKFFETHRLQSVQQYAEIRDHGRQVILSHYPVFCYKGQYRRDKEGRPLTYMLYGHVHDTHDEKLINRFIMETRDTKVMSKHSTEPEPIQCNMINCFCMFSDYKPVTLDEWIVIDRKRRGQMKEEAYGYQSENR